LEIRHRAVPAKRRAIPLLQSTCAQERRLSPPLEDKENFWSSFCYMELIGMLPDLVGSWVFPAEPCRGRLRKKAEPQLPAKPYKILWIDC